MRIPRKTHTGQVVSPEKRAQLPRQCQQTCICFRSDVMARIALSHILLTVVSSLCHVVWKQIRSDRLDKPGSVIISRGILSKLGNPWYLFEYCGFSELDGAPERNS